MPFIIAAVGILVAVYFFVIRARNAANVATDVLDMANDVRLAARRFGFRRQTNVHPVETIEDPNLAIGAIATAFLEMDVLPTREQRDAMTDAFGYTLNLNFEDAQEVAILGHWFVSECGGPQPAVTRVTRKLVKLSGEAGFQPLLEVLNSTLSASSSAVNPQQKEALDEVKRAFRLT